MEVPFYETRGSRLRWLVSWRHRPHYGKAKSMERRKTTDIARRRLGYQRIVITYNTKSKRHLLPKLKVHTQLDLVHMQTTNVLTFLRQKAHNWEGKNAHSLHTIQVGRVNDTQFGKGKGHTIGKGKRHTVWEGQKAHTPCTHKCAGVRA